MSDSHGGAQNPRATHTRSSVPRDICLQTLMLKGLTVNYSNEVHIGHCHSSTGTDRHSLFLVVPRTGTPCSTWRRSGCTGRSA